MVPRRRPVLVHVIVSLELSGPGRLALELAARLDPGSWDTRIVSIRGGGLARLAEDAGIPVTVLDPEATLGSSRIRLAARPFTKLLRRFAREHPDIVHTHLLGPDVIGRLAALLSRIPVVMSTQHDETERALAYTLYRRFSGRFTEATVACSPSVLRYCRDVLRLPEKKLHLVTNGVDADMFAAGASEWHDPPTFTALGTLGAVKGHAQLIEAFALLEPRLPGARLLVCGDGPERGRLSEMVRERGLGGRVELRGASTEVTALLRETDVLVQPSLAEGMPFAVLEAMSAAKPVIATAVSALPEILGEGESGMLVPPADPRALADAMLELAGEPDRAVEMGQRGAERVRRLYSVHATVTGYENLYRLLLREKGTDSSA